MNEWLVIHRKESKSMPRTEEANQRIREERKEQVIWAAAQVFAHKGFSDTKIADIAAAAGISHGLAYRYFENKEEVYAAVVERAIHGAIRLAQAVLEQPGTPLQKLHWITEQMLLGQHRRPEYSLVVLHALTSEAASPEVREMLLRQANVVMDVVRRLIREGQSTGEVASADPEQLAHLYLSCIQGLAIAANFPGEVASVPLSADLLLRMLKP
jgi:AcrR family transcriptional regulator